MKFIAIICLFLFSGISGACQEPIKILYSPVFSVSFYKEYIFKFTENLERLTKCTVTNVLAPTYEAYVKALAKGQAHMSFVPSYYEYALTEFGYERILRGADGAKIVLVAKKKSLLSNDIAQLKGMEILAPGIYTEAYLLLIDWLNEYKIFSDVNITMERSHDILAMKLVRDQTSAGVLSTSIFKRLPNSIQDSFYIMKESSDLYALLMVKNNLSKTSREAINKSSPLIVLGKWYESLDVSKPTKNAMRLHEQFKELIGK